MPAAQPPAVPPAFEVRRPGYDFGGNDTGHHTHGTGFIVAKDFLHNVLRYDAVSDRISVLRIRGQFANISLVNVYAPTELAVDETKDQFYEQLELIYDQLPSYDIKIVLGDFNAKIGREDIYVPTIGTHSKHTHSNDNGLRLISFASAKAMVVKSTMFPHKDIYKGTWRSPDGYTINQIDHVAIDERHKRTIEDVRTFRGADCDSDHYLLGIKLKFRIKSVKKHSQTAEDRIDIDNLKSQNMKETFQLELSNRFKDLDINDPIDTVWENI
ncbi:craniofacial development protein 2-like [Colias croceus]|uniref:craniofacial development protein 2-like n=1 Tax=Colias crocea TaxID=72248 RepID=UPI001E27EBD7|nr:craniofacial development protein 2-like [Colias croceus]